MRRCRRSGPLSAASAPHLVFIQDPVAGTSTLNLTDKTAWKNPMSPGGTDGPGAYWHIFHTEGDRAAPSPPGTSHDCLTKHCADEQLEANTGIPWLSDDGRCHCEWGAYYTHNSCTGQIGNERTISIVTEVWTSTDLKTNYLQQAERSANGRANIPVNEHRARRATTLRYSQCRRDFKIVDGGPKTIIYRRNQLQVRPIFVTRHFRFCP